MPANPTHTFEVGQMVTTGSGTKWKVIELGGTTPTSAVVELIDPGQAIGWQRHVEVIGSATLHCQQDEIEPI